MKYGCAVPVAVVVALAGCSARGASPGAPVRKLSVLPIPARQQDSAAPSSGWCGETAIQEALLYYGVWAPQRLINAAGRPKHPDLYSDEVPVALDALGLRYDFYRARRAGFAAYKHWVQQAIDAGHPVLAGVKILPTQHPEWGLDHFVLAVGHGGAGLLVNTTWGSRHWVSDTATEGLSLRNAVYAIRITGRLLPPGVSAARLSVLSEDATQVRLSVSCPGTTPRVESVAASRISRFECVPQAPQGAEAASARKY